MPTSTTPPSRPDLPRWRRIAEGIGLSVSALLLLNGWNGPTENCGTPNSGTTMNPAVPNRITGKDGETVVAVTTTGARQHVARLVIDQVITRPNRRTIGSTSAPVSPDTDTTPVIVRFMADSGSNFSDTLRLRALDACGDDITSVDIPSEAWSDGKGYGGADSIRATLAIPGDWVPKCSPSPSPSPPLAPSPSPTPAETAATGPLPQRFSGELAAAIAESNPSGGTIRATITHPFAYQRIRRLADRTVTPASGAPYRQAAFVYVGPPEILHRLQVATLGDPQVSQTMQASSLRGNLWAEVRGERTTPESLPVKLFGPVAGGDWWEIQTATTATTRIGWLRGAGKYGYELVMNAWTEGGGNVTLRLITPDGTVVEPTLVNATTAGIDATVAWPTSGGLSGHFEWRFSAGGRDVAIYTSNDLTLATESVTTVRQRSSAASGGSRQILPVQAGAVTATNGTDHASDGN